MRQAYQNAMRHLRVLPASVQLIIAVPGVSVLALASASGGEYSLEEQEACTSDAFQFCSEFIPDIPRITKCMQAKRDRLSPACARMFAPNRDRHLDDPNQAPHANQKMPKSDDDDN
jgi:hypothetical protein